MKANTEKVAITQDSAINTSFYNIKTLLICAYCLRLVIWFVFPNYYKPDALFQALEPAHLLAFGYGHLNWEWHVGIRSWLFPGFLALIMKLTAPLGGGSFSYLFAIHVVMSAFSLIPIYVTYRLAATLTFNKAALLAAMLPAFWYELVYMAPMTLNGCLPVYLFILAIYWLIIHKQQQTNDCIRLFNVGALLGVITILRFALLPAIFVCLLYGLYKSSNKQRGYLLIGFSLLFFLGGMLDWYTWQYPFQSIIKNIDLNIFQHIAAQAFGSRPFYQYVLWLLLYKLLLIFPILYLAYLAAKRYPLLAFVVLANFISLSMIGHKEYRFIYLTVVIMMMMAGIGAAIYIKRRQFQIKMSLKNMLVLVALLLWPIFPLAYYKAREWPLAATMQVSRQLQQHRYGKVQRIVFNGYKDILKTGGYTYLHANIPLKFTMNNAALYRYLQQVQGMTIIISKSKIAKLSHQLQFCKDAVCVYAVSRLQR